MIKINEIFFSIQGESSFVGAPTVFIRTTGCNLRCTYCDTKYSYHEGSFKSIEDILAEVKNYNTKYVCITGGEPMIHKNIYKLMDVLLEEDYTVSLETSGSYSCEEVDDRVLKVIDIKTPDSGEVYSFNEKNLQLRSVNCEFKFIICSENDLEWAEDFCRRTHLFEKFKVLYSPSYEQFSLKTLADQMIKKGSLAKLQCQLHKFIWGDEVRGV